MVAFKVFGVARRLLGLCPECGHRSLIEAGYSSQGCEWCGWTDEPCCGHGILESEWCPQCPGGGV